MERMINTRLVWFLEKNNILIKYQSGFRKGQTTTDQLIRLESFIRDSFLKGNHVVSVFFDLERANDHLLVRDWNMVVLFSVLLISHILRNWNPFKTKALEYA